MRIQIKFILFLLTALSGHLSTTLAEEAAMEFTPWVVKHVQEVLHEHFGPGKEEGAEMKLLTGGYSAASLKLQVAGKTYVLRVIGSHEPPLRMQTELYAMKNAAAAGIAPPIHWISADGYAILMDYVAGGTLTLEKGRDPEVIRILGAMIKKVHALAKNPYSAPAFEDHMENFYRTHAPGSPGFATWESAIATIREGASQLRALNSPSVNTHGDLNPRNIVVEDQKLYFIDWSEGTYTDPFHDLGYFSAMMDYGTAEDAQLLTSYLGKQPTFIEKKRFLLAKKMNFARLALGGQFIGNKLHADKPGEFLKPEPLKGWSYYADKFANQNILFSPDHFWNMAKAALVAADAIDMTSIQEDY